MFSGRNGSPVVRALCSTRGLFLLTSVACSKPPAAERPPAAVTIAVVTKRAAPFLLIANGMVEPINTVAVQAQVSGTLNRVFFHEGEDVKAGQLLFQIDPRIYAAALHQAEAILARDAAQAENASRDADRYTALVAKDYVTKSQADQATASAAAARSLVDADRATVENARLNVEYASMRAPISGRTGSLVVREGNLVRAGSGPALVVINQIHPIRVRFAAPENQLPEVQRYAKAHKITVKVTPTGSAGGEEVGTLSFVDNGVDSTTGTVALKGEFPNANGRLWPGQFVSVEVELYSEPDAITVPSQAVMTGQNGTYVFVIDDSSRAQPKPVKVARTVKEWTVIEAGLSPGMQVVIDGQARLDAGTKVAVKSVADSLVAGAPSGAPTQVK